MQVIAVERWTFWGAVLLMVVGFAVESVVGPIYNFSGGTEYDPAYAIFVAALIVFLASVILGISRDPTVRNLPRTKSD